jgi:acyl carrier protein
MNETPEKLSEEKLREKLEAFPADFQEAVLRYHATPNADILDQIVHGLLHYHVGEDFEELHGQKGGDVLLVEDLQIDSLTLVEISFQAEDFVGYAIQIEDFEQIHSLADLQTFLRQEVFPDSTSTA